MTKVLKFGGTSLKDELSRLKVVSIIKETLKKDKVIVVVSAIGRFPEAYATDTLGSLISDKVNEFERDKLITCGEMISSVVLLDILIREGIKARTFSSYECQLQAKRINKHYVLESVDTQLLESSLDEYDVLILPGFQGIDHRSVVTLERGGSDYSALFIAKQLGLKEVDIYSDVCGIYTGDPKYIINARLIPHISYDQALDLASYKARIICEEALIVAKKHDIVIYLKSTFMKECFTRIDGKETNIKIVGMDFDYKIDPNQKLIDFDKEELKKDFKSHLSKENYALVHFVGDLDLKDFIHLMEKGTYLLTSEHKTCFIRQDKLLSYLNRIHDIFLLEE